MADAAYDGWVRGLRPVQDEQDAVQACVIAGKVPEDLNGSLYRCGPSQRVLPPQGQRGLHLFDGDGLMQRLVFAEGRVWHCSRFVRTASFVLEQQAGVFNQHALGVRAERPISGVQMRQQQNTNVIYHAGLLLALVESATPVQIDPGSLRRLGEYAFGLRTAGRPLSAHPKIDGVTGEMFIHGCYPVAPYLQLHCIGPDGVVRWSRDLDTPSCAWVHDIALTENYVIVPLSPVDIQVATEDGRWVPTDPYVMRRDLRLRWLICSRATGETCAEISSPSSELVVHVGAAHERRGQVVVDAVTYGEPEAYLGWLKVVRGGGRVAGAYARYVRHHLTVAGGTAESTVLVERASEFPRVDDRTVGGPSRWTYLVISASPAKSRTPAPWSAMARLDNASGNLEEYALPTGTWLSEPVFAPRTSSAGVDDGYLLALAYDAGSDESRLLVFDAQELTAGPVATLRLPSRVPFTFHGSFMPTVAGALAGS